MKRFVLSLSSLILLAAITSACGESSNSYASILIYDQQQYIGENLISLNEYPDKELVGTVSEQTGLDEMPRKNFSSNELSVGTKIYALGDKLLVAQIGETELRLFRLRVPG